jgi:hypothetical protein
MHYSAEGRESGCLDSILYSRSLHSGLKFLILYSTIYFVSEHLLELSISYTFLPLKTNEHVKRLKNTQPKLKISTLVVENCLFK